MAPPRYRTAYTSSRALVVGVNVYQHASPLSLAVADAEGIAAVLQSQFSFDAANVTVLRDSDATKTAILDAFFSFANETNASDDRIVIFFAGHGHTLQTRRGDVGFLVPHDGDTANIASLIRWQELTEGADMFEAKHVLFLMDACYGGLALNRGLTPGSMRFVNDMLLRPSRQVLTAGKANEPVGDVGGPIAGHSPFTGDLLEALGGKATYGEGVITANGVMAYVYQSVGRDARSFQTPHYGYLEGDGDLIFAAPILSPEKQAEVASSMRDEDELLSVPAVVGAGEASMNGDELVSRVKEYLSEDRHRIQLHDTVADETRRVLLQTADDSFAVQGTWSPEEFRARVGRYEEVLRGLSRIETLLGRWAGDETRSIVGLAPRRLADRIGGASGLTMWIGLRWYPVLLLLYCGGIAAVTAEQYENLRELFTTRVRPEHEDEKALVEAVIDGVDRAADGFKLLPGHERHYTPRSEYLHKLLQPIIDDLLFLGSDYESAFDRFEILMALEYMHQSDTGFAPVGRFGWKIRRGANPLFKLLAEAEKQGTAWPPLRAGLFDGSAARFAELAARMKQFAERISWF